MLCCNTDELPDNFASQEKLEPGLELKKLREEACLTQSGLAELLSATKGRQISKLLVQNWEKGELVELSIPQVKTLCQILKISLDSLADLVEPPS